MNLVLSIYCYYRLYQKRVLFDNRYAMTVTISASMLVSLVISMQLSFLFPTTNSYLSIPLIILGIVVGIIFGALERFQTILTGMLGGFTGGTMGSMAGAVVKDPTLCGLPLLAEKQIFINMISFSLFSSILLLITVWLILFSMRV